MNAEQRFGVQHQKHLILHPLHAANRVLLQNCSLLFPLQVELISPVMLALAPLKRYKVVFADAVRTCHPGVSPWEVVVLRDMSGFHFILYCLHVVLLLKDSDFKPPLKIHSGALGLVSLLWTRALFGAFLGLQPTGAQALVGAVQALRVQAPNYVIPVGLYHTPFLMVTLFWS